MILNSRYEPIAIVGVGMRLPGDVRDLESFYQALLTKAEFSGPIDRDRWAYHLSSDPVAGKLLDRAVTAGSFLADPYGFDYRYFGLTPREAVELDPQQRIALEVSAEALEDAGEVLQQISTRRFGVYIGQCNDDYRRRRLEALPAVGPWTGIGVARCGTANRISYHLDLHGPSVVMDTACSASLTAVHAACRALQDRECDAALAGGVNLLLAAGETLSLAAAGAISPDGTCKPFSRLADGYGRSEGSAVFVLKRMSDALAAHDKIYAAIVGSGLSQDGHTEGIMHPSTAGQVLAMRQALEAGELNASDVQYVEAHGTGTPVGDPTEIAAIDAVYGSGTERSRDVVVGSVKGNFGHLEGAAGAIGLLKLIAIAGTRTIPPTIVNGGLSDDVPWSSTKVNVAVAEEPLAVDEADDGRTLLAVSSFGYGGSNAHLVLERLASPVGDGVLPQAPPRLVGATGDTRDIVELSINDLSEGLRRNPSRARDLGALASARQRPSDHWRAAALVESAGSETPNYALSRVRTAELSSDASRGAPVWLFSGHGAQHDGMAQQLVRSATGTDTLAALQDILREVYQTDVVQRMADGWIAGYTPDDQCAIFVAQVLLSRHLMSCGLRPSVVIGHSVGEVAAAVCTAEIDLETGARLIAHRSSALRQVESNGGMLQVSCAAERAAEVVGATAGNSVEVAVISSPESCVLSGPKELVAEVRAAFEAADISARQVRSDVAFHSAAVDPVLDSFESAISLLGFSGPDIRRISTVTGAEVLQPTDASYWRRNLRRPVRLEDALTIAVTEGLGPFIEVSAHPILASPVLETASAHGYDVPVVATLTRADSSTERLERVPVDAFLAGSPLRVEGRSSASRVSRSDWSTPRRWNWQSVMEPTPKPSTSASRGVVAEPASLVGRIEHVGPTDTIFSSTTCSIESRPYSGSHAIDGVEIVPASVLVQSIIDISESTVPFGLRGVVFEEPVVLQEDPTDLLVSLAGDVGRVSVVGEEGVKPARRSWRACFTATVDSVAQHRIELPAVSLSADDPEIVLRRLRAAGLDSHPFAWRIESIVTGGTAEPALTAVVDLGAETSPAERPATAIDAAFSLGPVLFRDERGTRMVRACSGMDLLTDPPRRLAISAWRPANTVDVVHILAADVETGLPAFELRETRYVFVPRDAQRGLAETATAPSAARSDADGVYRILSAVMGLDSPTGLALSRGLGDQGFDSIMATRVRLEVRRAFGTDVPAAVFLGNPTPHDVADKILEGCGLL